jgi:hypothetical protein
MEDQPEMRSKSQSIAQAAGILPQKPRAGILQTIKSEWLGTALLLLDGDTLVPLQAAVAGVRFRHWPARQEIKRGRLFQQPAFWMMAPWDLPPAVFQFEDASGQPIPAGAEALSAESMRRKPSNCTPPFCTTDSTSTDSAGATAC